MKQVKNKLVPWGGFKAMALWPFIFIRSDKKMKAEDLRHEKIHGRQQAELLIVGFWILYVVNCIVEFCLCSANQNRGQQTNPRYKRRNLWHRISHALVLEREAYSKQGDKQYLEKRPWMGWTKFFNKTIV